MVLGCIFLQSLCSSNLSDHDYYVPKQAAHLHDYYPRSGMLLKKLYTCRLAAAADGKLERFVSKLINLSTVILHELVHGIFLVHALFESSF